ncbi:MAG: hypothetical protein ACYTGQ_13425 [Planctomycetota bacterium]|jgi:hypothetical protein
MAEQPDNPLVFPIVKASLTLIVVVLASALGVYWLLINVLGFESQARPSVVGASVSVLIGLSGFVPVWLMSRKSAHGSAYGFMVSILVRCVVGFAAVAWLRWGMGGPDAEATLMWVAGYYMLVLGLEVTLISRHVLAATTPVPVTPEMN